MDDTAANTCHMLALPPEMLQHISSFVTAEALMMFRLTRKGLEAASFDGFAQEYLSTLRCYFPDTARIKRANKIVSRPAFARKVRELCLSTNPFEGHGTEDIHDVQRPAWQCSCLSNHQQHAYKYHRDTQMHLHQNRKPELVGLSNILRAINPSCSIVVDFNRYWPDKSVVDHGEYPFLSCDVLGLAANLDVSITDLSLNDQDIRYMGSVPSNEEKLKTLSLRLERFTFFLTEADDVDIFYPDNLHAMPRMLKLAICLKSFSVILDLRRVDHASIDSVTELGTNMLLANHLSHLR